MYYNNISSPRVPILAAASSMGWILPELVSYDAIRLTGATKSVRHYVRIVRMFVLV